MLLKGLLGIAIRNEYRLLINGGGFPAPCTLKSRILPYFCWLLPLCAVSIARFCTMLYNFPYFSLFPPHWESRFTALPPSPPSRTPPTPFSPRLSPPPPCPSLYAKEELNWSNLESKSKPALIPLFPFLLVFIQINDTGLFDTRLLHGCMNALLTC